MTIETHTASSIDELVRVVLSICDQLPQDGSLWYRGVQSMDYKLIPKIMRDDRSFEAVLEREKRLLARFRQRSMAYWSSLNVQDEWEYLFAMQHYGLPTRLLDWSENLFVAAYFALTNPSHEGGAYKNPVIWCLDPVQWNRCMPGLSEYGSSIHVLTTVDEELETYQTNAKRRRQKSPVAMYGAHNSNRIVAQRGTFMVWGAEVKSLQEVANDLSDAKLWCVRLDGARGDLARSLRALGFLETMIFPELPYLAEELQRSEGWR
jgi:hypothetical protein